MKTAAFTSWYVIQNPSNEHIENPVAFLTSSLQDCCSTHVSGRNANDQRVHKQ